MIVAEKTQKISILVLFNVLCIYKIYLCYQIFVPRKISGKQTLQNMPQYCDYKEGILRSTVASHDFFRCHTVCEGYYT